MPGIIANGSYRRNELYKNRTDGTGVFYEYRMKVQTSQGEKEVFVDVAEKANPKQSQAKHQVYNMTREGTKNYEDRKKSLAGDSGMSLNQARDSFNENNLSPTYEIVNVRYS